MKRIHKLGLGLLILASLGALVYANRIYVLEYSLGWYTDIRHPRGPYQEVPWVQGPPHRGNSAGQKAAQHHRHHGR